MDIIEEAKREVARLSQQLDYLVNIEEYFSDPHGPKFIDLPYQISPEAFDLFVRLLSVHLIKSGLFLIYPMRSSSVPHLTIANVGGKNG